MSGWHGLQRYICVATLGWVALAAVALQGFAQDAFNREPINYGSARPDDAVSRLQARIEKGDATLEHDSEHGYLKALLRELQIPVSSQVLVFSKTSFQPSHISPRAPRALYFNDEAYVGWVQNSPTLEVSAADGKLGRASCRERV